MTPLVIGTGFVGQAVIQRLVRDHDVVLTYGRLDDLDELALFLTAHTPSVVVLASGSPRHAGFRLDRHTINDHVLVAERVATYARTASARVIYVSSILVLQPTRTDYGALKLFVEHVVDGPRTVILRAGTVVGNLNDRNQSVLHKFVRATVAGLSCPIHEEAVGRTIYLVTRDQLADEVARSLTSSVPRGPSIVATWQGSVSDLARLVTARWQRLVDHCEAGAVHLEKLSMIPTIDAMLMQARTE